MIMIDKIEKVYDNGKKSLDSLLKERAFNEVEKELKKRDININEVSDEDIEVLVSERVKDMESGLKGFGIGSAFAIAVSLLTGV